MMMNAQTNTNANTNYSINDQKGLKDKSNIKTINTMNSQSENQTKAKRSRKTKVIETPQEEEVVNVVIEIEEKEREEEEAGENEEREEEEAGEDEERDLYDNGDITEDAEAMEESRKIHEEEERKREREEREKARREAKIKRELEQKEKLRLFMEQQERERLEEEKRELEEAIENGDNYEEIKAELIKKYEADINRTDEEWGKNCDKMKRLQEELKALEELNIDLSCEGDCLREKINDLNDAEGMDDLTEEMKTEFVEIFMKKNEKKNIKVKTITSVEKVEVKYVETKAREKKAGDGKSGRKNAVAEGGYKKTGCLRDVFKTNTRVRCLWKKSLTINAIFNAQIGKIEWAGKHYDTLNEWVNESEYAIWRTHDELAGKIMSDPKKSAKKICEYEDGAGNWASFATL